MSIRFQELTDKKHVTILMLCIGFVQIAGYYLAGMLASPDGSMAVPQPDTLLYCQAARRIVEGQAIHFLWQVSGLTPFFILFSLLDGDRPFGIGLNILGRASPQPFYLPSPDNPPFARWHKATSAAGWL